MHHFPYSCGKCLFLPVVKTCLLVLTTLLVACSDPETRDFLPDQLLGLVDLDIDVHTRNVNATARVSDVAIENIDEQADTLVNEFSLIRLVDGDAFFIDWEGSSFQLYRRTRDFIYQTEFAALSTRELIVRLNFQSAAGPSQSTQSVQLPDINSFQLLQTAQTVASDSNLDLSWNLNLDSQSAAQSIDRIEVLTIPVNCFDEAGLTVPIDNAAAVTSIFPADSDATTLAIAAGEIVQPLFSQGFNVSNCNIDIQLQVRMTLQLIEENQADLHTRVTTLSPVESVTILDAAPIGITSSRASNAQ
ncbi:MAG: hypothetical protein KTR32_40245 [Granulosicoccus sp.]|nr:hypothetical protein [Granulosicoccus sp.]